MTGTIFFDIGNVLVKFSHEKMVQQIADVCGLTTSEIYDFLFTKNYCNQYQLGNISGETLHKMLLEQSSNKVSFDTLMHAVCNIFEEMEGMLNLIKTLKKKKHALILLSNTCEAHFDFIEKHYPIVKYFDNKVLSYKVGLRKPNPKIFLQSLELAKNTMNFYTDDLEENIAAAKKIGLDAVRFEDVNQITKELAQRNFLS